MAKLFLLLLFFVVSSYSGDTVMVADSTVSAGEDVAGQKALGAADSTAMVAGVKDSTDDTLRSSDTTAAPLRSKAAAKADTTGEKGVRKIKLIKREYNYRQQMTLAIGMMSFIAIMMASSQNWNPK